MYVLTSNITIGQYKAVKPIQVKVEKSIYNYVDCATILLPITSRIVRAGDIITQSVETAKLLEEGQAVQIALGYDGNNKTEFRGFVSRVNFTTPLELECEGYSYQLRNRTYKKTFKNSQLMDVLNFLIVGTDIELEAKQIPKLLIAKIAFANHSGVECLELLKKTTANTINIYFFGNILRANLLAIQAGNTIKFRLGWNVVSANNLKLRQAKNQNVVVRFMGMKKDGSIIKATAGKQHTSNVVATGKAGNSGEVKEVKLHGVTDAESLEIMAKKTLQKLQYNGYEGKITCFGIPYCQPNDAADIEDEKYVERSGKYLIESTEVTYSTSGLRRLVGIGLKLAK